MGRARRKKGPKKEDSRELQMDGEIVRNEDREERGLGKAPETWREREKKANSEKQGAK